MRLNYNKGIPTLVIIVIMAGIGFGIGGLISFVSARAESSRYTPPYYVVAYAECLNSRLPLDGNQSVTVKASYENILLNINEGILDYEDIQIVYRNLNCGDLPEYIEFISLN